MKFLEENRGIILVFYFELGNSFSDMTGKASKKGNIIEIEH